MGGEDYEALCDSITNIGVQNPITLFEGMVIDGWHRYKASIEVGMPCQTVELGDVDPKDFVIAQNKARRHILAGQMAMAVTAVHSWRAVGANQHSEIRVCSPADPQKTSSELANIAGVGVRTISQAKAVQLHGVPEVIDAAKRGEVGLEKAAAIAKLPKEEQAAALHKPTPKPFSKPIPTPETDREQAPAQEPEPEYTQIDAANDQISDLQRDLVVALMGNVPDDQKNQAANKIDELHAELKSLSAQIKGLTIARDAYMAENSSMKVHIAAQKREIAKLKKPT